ncbi:MAG TPA: NUDIX domain-containing protein [Candidatus Stackebrandtia faecavium]|nr:NUDIX domain-containing protein [Candidatus Stackebrandtia faecavium]
MTGRGQSSGNAASFVRSAIYKTFYSLPKPLKRRIVRVVAPTYTVGAVMMVYSPDKTRLLLLRQPPGHGWGLPAGLLNRGERPETAAVRELGEETGIKLTIDDIELASPNAIVHARGRWVDMVFTTTLVPEDVTLEVDGAEVWEAQWHRLDALPPITVAASRLLAHYGIGPYADYPADARID